MRILLDTHVLLWWWEDSPRLSARARGILAEEEHDLFVSPASLWEIAIKVGLGRLDPAIPLGELEAAVRADGFLPLPIRLAHGLRAGSYAHPHRDPFDRMLAAQAELEGIPLLTRDSALDAFPCATIWT